MFKFIKLVSSMVLAILYTLFISVRSQPVQAASFDLTQIKTVFLILMENHNWVDVNKDPNILTLVSRGAHAEQYYSPTGIHPSEPNYIWLEAGSNLGVTNDSDPSANHLATTQHLVTLLTNAGISWKAYEEDIPGTNCPLHGVGKYAPKHSGMIFFDDVTGTNNPSFPYCISHYRPYTEFLSDLTANSVSRYNFITPNLCNDMHDCSVSTGSTWLAQNVPLIMNSQAYKNNGAIFITWDENEGGNFPIGMMILSPLVKTLGYSNSIHYDHSSMLKTAEEIFGVIPLLGHAADSSTSDLNDLFAGGNGTPVVTPPQVTPTPTTWAPSPTVYIPPTSTPTPTGKTTTTTPTPTPCAVTLPTNTGTARMTVDIPSDGSYSIWTRMMGQGDGANSFWLQIDTNCPVDIGDLNSSGISGGMPANVWTWVNYAQGNISAQISVNLTAGLHNVLLIGRGQNLKVDKLIFDKTPCIPQGGGDNCLQSGVSPTPTPTGTTGNSNHSGSGNSSSELQTITPTADVSVDSDHPHTNYGHDATLWIDGSSKRITFMKFDLRSLTQTSINSAILRLYVRNYTKASQTVYNVPNTLWNEASVTYLNKPDLGTQIGILHGGNEGEFITINLTDYINSHKGSQAAIAIQQSGSDALGLGSKESRQPPHLVVNGSNSTGKEKTESSDKKSEDEDK